MTNDGTYQQKYSYSLKKEKLKNLINTASTKIKIKIVNKEIKQK